MSSQIFHPTTLDRQRCPITSHIPTTVPLLFDLLRAYEAVCAAVVNAFSTCEIYCRHLDPPAEPTPTLILRDIPELEFTWDPQAAFADFVTRCGEVQSRIADVVARWEVIGHLLQEELRLSLASLPWGCEWILRAGDPTIFPSSASRRLALLDGLPLISMDARWHLRQFSYLFTALESAVTRIESARGVDAPNCRITQPDPDEMVLFRCTFRHEFPLRMGWLNPLTAQPSKEEEVAT
ncbi:hypothetical protein DFH09DRAFT_1401067 [Mycena vulgaris]|nr:hypothetical protein DFH09DRAFT_1401067 [Mycena vulgaris]